MRSAMRPFGMSSRLCLSESGVSDYTIFLEEESGKLFAFQRTQGEGGSQDLGSNPIVQRWWAYMADIMETNEDNSPSLNTASRSFSYGLSKKTFEIA
ncbi:MAG: L-rhamnose mutarotase [Sphaerochaeta sp.]